MPIRHLIARPIHVVFSLALGLVWLLPSAPATGASAPPTLLPTWTPDGPVYAVVQSGTTIYLGGDFSAIGPPTGGFITTDTSSASIATHWPQVQGEVTAIAPDGSGGWYIGGEFSRVGDQARTRLAHLFSDGSLDPNWQPTPSGQIEHLISNGAAVYVSGTFASTA